MMTGNMNINCNKNDYFNKGDSKIYNLLSSLS